jgi:nitrate/nitrite transporter NarK
VLSAVLVALGYALWLPFHDSTGQALLNMAVAGLGSGALVAALPATAAAAAPPERTGFATGMTNATKTVGGAIASSIFAISLASTGSIADPPRATRRCPAT